MSSAQERLRRYLEQRRELGESEFILDSMPVEDALRVLMSGGRYEADGTQSASAGQQVQGRPPGGATTPPVEPPSSSRIEGVSEDWRSVVTGPDSGGETMLQNANPKETDADGTIVPPDISVAQAKTIAEVAVAISNCRACSLYKTALNHVPGDGNPHARFVVVGEAPGATEDEKGLPFVGRSGNLLTKILEAIGFKREDVFICNVIKHRPPGNRNPNSAEIEACKPFLLRQLEILEPKVILAVGTFAAQTLLSSTDPIGKLRGKEHLYHGIPLVATYHPAALLRNPNWKRPTWEDVQLARRIFDRA